jgi:Flp pilus assembly protein TadG
MIIRRALRDDRGQAFVELALVTPIFALLLVGATEFGYLAYRSIEVTNAARAGVAYAAQTATTAADTANITLAATNEAPDVTGMTVTITPACYCNNGTTTSIATCSTVGTTCVTSPTVTVVQIIQSIQVNTTASVTSPIHLPGIPNPFTVQGQATMNVEQ